MKQITTKNQLSDMIEVWLFVFCCFHKSGLGYDEHYTVSLRNIFQVLYDFYIDQINLWYILFSLGFCRFTPCLLYFCLDQLFFELLTFNVSLFCCNMCYAKSLFSHDYPPKCMFLVYDVLTS